MRLIDADALLNGYDVRKVTEYDEAGFGMTYNAVPVEAIEKAPAVDAEPVRHGWWVNLEPEIGLFECSECGHKILRARCNYCPNCGAKDGCGGERR